MSLRSFVFSATKILLLIGLSFTSLETLYAGNTVSVIRGPQGSRITLNWNVVGGSAQCIGATNYPITADSINSGWTTGPLHAGTGNTDSIAGWGTNFLAAPKAAPGYQFTCTDNNSAKFDTAWLIVDDCNPGDVWNGTACVPAGPPVIGVTFKATPNPVVFNTSTVLSWAVTGIVTSCTLSGGQYGAGVAVAATDNRTTNNLTVATTYTLGCTGPGGTDTQNVTVGVGGAPVASFTSFTFLPASVTVGGASTLTWTTTSGTSVGIVCSSGPAAAQTAWNDTGLNPNSNKPVTSTVGMVGVTTCLATAYGVGGNDTQSFTWTVNAVVNQPPLSPTIGGPITRNAGQSGTYDFSATDPEGDTLHYEIDWDNNGSVDQTLPVGYVPSGTLQSQANSWVGPGLKTFQVRAVDSNTNASPWASYDVTVTTPTGNFTSTPSCTITAGLSSCLASVSWTSSNLTTVVLTDCGGGPYTVTGVGPQTYNTLTIPYNSGCYEIHDGISAGPILDTIFGTSSCAPGSSWDGTKCVSASGSITLITSNCAIATGAGTCAVGVTWTISSAISPNIYNSTTLVTAYSVPSGTNQPVSITYGPNTIEARDGITPVASAVATAACAAGPTNWDTIGKVCADPQVGSAVVTNDYFTPAFVDFTCINSDGYELRKDPARANTLIASGPYTGPVSVPVSIQDYYKVICKHGSVTASQIVFYHYPAPVPTTSIDAYPKTLSTRGTSLISWGVAFPTALCTLKAFPVCANNICSQTQLAEVAKINTVITSSTTDQNDPQTTRPIATAVTVIAPGHINTDRKALGRKTFNIVKSTDFTIDCGGAKKATTRVRVANSDEQ